jgi:hypothetical protein
MRTQTPLILTSACRAGSHDRCFHRNDYGGGFPKRLHGGFQITLCGCDCHAACPLVGYGQVSDREWEMTCSCPGAEQVQRITRRQHEDDQRVRAAMDVVQARAGGKTRAEIHEMLITELRAGPRVLPSNVSLNAAVEEIARHSEQTAAGRTGVAHAVAMFAGDLRLLSRFFREGVKNNVSDPSGRAAYFVSRDSAASGLEVILLPAAAQILDALEEGQRVWDAMGGVEPGEDGQRIPPGRMVPVWLDSGASGSATTRPVVTVHVGRHRLGELSPGDGAFLDHDLEVAREQNQSVWMIGHYFQRTAAGARLRLYPGTLPFP